MQVQLILVEPGGGQVERTAAVELPALPVSGDVLFLEGGAFVVRRRIFRAGEPPTVAVEAEYAEHPDNSEAHRGVIKRYLTKNWRKAVTV